jgi:predicted  nucleic acid-binding Zn-ribbon protein
LGETEEVKQARQRVAQTEDELHSWHGKQTDAELEGRSLVDRIDDTEQRLMSGAVRNPKELESLQESLDALRRQRVAVEDSAVEAFEQSEVLAHRLDDARTALTQVESAWTNGQAELREEETKLKQNAILLKRKRDSVAQAMGPDLLERYEHMRKRKAGIAIAPLQNGICGACHVKVPTGVVSAIRSANHALVTCTSCGRYLYAA